MIYFTLPGFYQNFKINNFFIKLSLRDLDFFKTPVSFIACAGNFPYNYWNGGFNNCIEKGCIYNEIYDCNKENGAPLRLNCTNIFLNSNDFEDSVANTILDICHDSSNLIEVSNLDLYKILKEKYNKYKFIFSKQANLIYPFNLNIINELNNKKYFEIVSLPNEFSKNLNLLKEINNPNTIELTVNSMCQTCNNEKKCQYANHVNQYNYSMINSYLNCEKRYPYHRINPLITLEEIKDTYIPMGYKYFKIEEIFNNDKDNLFLFLLNYFIKEEYKEEVYNLAFEEGIILV